EEAPMVHAIEKVLGEPIERRYVAEFDYGGAHPSLATANGGNSGRQSGNGSRQGGASSTRSDGRTGSSNRAADGRGGASSRTRRRRTSRRRTSQTNSGRPHRSQTKSH
ncbi:MAG: hypothetical protein R2854_12245, partial [Caldilineaceae bacterium]